MAERLDEYFVIPKQSDQTQEKEIRKLKERIDKYKEGKQKLEEKMHNLKSREKLSASQQAHLDRLQDAYNRLHQQLRLFGEALQDLILRKNLIMDKIPIILPQTELEELVTVMIVEEDSPPPPAQFSDEEEQG